jgi:hypothetical protein
LQHLLIQQLRKSGMRVPAGWTFFFPAASYRNPVRCFETRTFPETRRLHSPFLGQRGRFETTGLVVAPDFLQHLDENKHKTFNRSQATL